jgi:hypothetical protein
MQTALSNRLVTNEEVLNYDDELVLECYENILRNINRNLELQANDQSIVSKLLSARWFLRNEAELIAC